MLPSSGPCEPSAKPDRAAPGFSNHDVLFHLLCFYGTCMGMALAIDAYAQRKHMLLFIKQANSLARYVG